MTDDGRTGGRPDGRQVSRRGLFGAFRRSARTLREGLGDVQAAGRRSPPPPPPVEQASYPRLVRPHEQVVIARASGHSAWDVDLTGKVPAPGGSVVALGGGLPEPLVIVRVSAHHWSACTAECPMDGSHIGYHADQDLLVCPACDSAWRMDGDVMRPPADSPLARLVVDAYLNDDGGAEARVYLP